MKNKEKGQEIVEFALVSLMIIPVFIGMFVTGMNLIVSIQTNNMVRNLGNLYIHGADFSSYAYQDLARRMGTGLNLQMPSFSGNLQSNTSTSGDGIVRITQLMYVGTNTDPNCVAVGAANCVNRNSFVFTQRVVFGNSSVETAHPSFAGDPTGATLSSMESVSNPVTDVHAALSISAQTAMNSLWQTTANGQQPLKDGQILYVSEAYFQTPSLSLGNVTSNGVYARCFF